MPVPTSVEPRREDLGVNRPPPSPLCDNKKTTNGTGIHLVTGFTRCWVAPSPLRDNKKTTNGTGMHRIREFAGRGMEDSVGWEQGTPLPPARQQKNNKRNPDAQNQGIFREW